MGQSLNFTIKGNGFIYCNDDKFGITPAFISVEQMTSTMNVLPNIRPLRITLHHLLATLPGLILMIVSRHVVHLS